MIEKGLISKRNQSFFDEIKKYVSYLSRATALV